MQHAYNDSYCSDQLLAIIIIIIIIIIIRTYQVKHP